MKSENFSLLQKKRSGIITVRFPNIKKQNCDGRRENLKTFNEIEKNRSDILK